MTPLRIRISTEVSKQLTATLRQAYRAGDLRLVRRVTALLALGRGETVPSIAETLGVSRASVYAWLQTLLVEGLAGLRVQWRGGRPSKLTRTQKRRLVRLVEVVKAGPQAAGFPTGCWNTCLIQEVIQREFGVAYNVHSLAALLKNLGFSFQKARFVSDHLDEARRLAWLPTTWPAWRQRAEAAGGWRLFGDDASFAQWGSLGYTWTWAPVGEQPVVPTTGKRKAYKVFGLIDFFTGRLFYQGHTGRFNGESYLAFLTTVLGQTTQPVFPVFLVQDGAPYHRSAPVTRFFQAQADRLCLTQLPSYSPDYNPIEFLWRATKRQATHNRSFPEFETRIGSVEEALAAFAQQPERVKARFGLYLDQMAQPTAPAAAA
jgi:transposase